MTFGKLSLLIAVLACGIRTGPASAQSCPPFGEFFFYTGFYYDHIANGQPASTDCWTLSGNVQLVSTPSCTYNTANAFDMHYGARVIQQLTVPSTRTGTDWHLSYLLTMQDPHDDAWWNRLKATVYDVTTQRVLATQTYRGDYPDITCSPRNLAFTGNLAGHTLQVIFADGSAYADTVVRVRSIALVQH
jgi:hypothetical protein